MISEIDGLRALSSVPSEDLFFLGMVVVVIALILIIALVPDEEAQRADRKRAREQYWNQKGGWH